MPNRINNFVKKYLNKEVLVLDIKHLTKQIIPKDRTIPSNDQIQNSSEVWIDASYDPIEVTIDPYATVIQQIKALNPNTKVLTANFNYYYENNPEIRYCPFWFLQVYPVRSFRPKDIRRFKFSCLNREPKPHRLMNYCLFRKASYLPDSCVSFWGKHTYATDFTSAQHDNVLDRMVQKCNDQTVSEIFAELRSELPYHPYESLYNGENDHEIIHPAYSDTYINVVTETSCDFSGIYGHSDAPIITEKTVKPMLARQMFLMSADSLSVDFLRDQGVDMFDDVINHSYDTVRGFTAKTQAIHAELLRLSQLDLQEIFAKHKVRLENNYKRLFDKKFLHNIAKQLLIG